MDRVGFVPVGGDLQDGRPAEPAVGEEQFFTKTALAARHNHGRGDAGEVSKKLMLCAKERERNQRRTAGLDGNQKLAGNVVAEPRRAHLRNR